MTQMEKLTEECCEDLELEAKAVKLNRSTAQIGYHFRVSRKNEKNLRSCKQYTCIETRKDGVRFTSMQMKKIAREYEDLSKEYDEQQGVIVQKALEVVQSYIPVFESVSDVLAHLDTLVAFSVASSVASPVYVRPILKPRSSISSKATASNESKSNSSSSNSSSSSSSSSSSDGDVNMLDSSSLTSSQRASRLRLVGARHPCVEVMDQVSFISNDCELVKGVSNVQIITGPNMGGKSTYIRQVGVIVLMAQIGCFVPADEAELAIVDCIMCRVGAGNLMISTIKFHDV
jgi:DNA mismatch repair protein MSH2